MQAATAQLIEHSPSWWVIGPTPLNEETMMMLQRIERHWPRVAVAAMLMVVGASASAASTQASAPASCQNYLAARGLSQTPLYQWCSAGHSFAWTSTLPENQGQTTQVFWSCHGQRGKPAVLMIHGWPTSSFDFSKLVANLQDRYYLCSLDTPGYGLSEKKLKGYTYSILDDAKLVDHFVSQVAQLSSFTLLTHDKGDSVGLAFLQNYLKAKTSASPPSYVVSQHVILNGNIHLPQAHLSGLQLSLLDPNTGAAYADSLSATQVAVELGLSSYAPPLTDATELNELAALLDYQDGSSGPQSGVTVLDNTVQYLNERKTYEDQWLDVLGSSGLPTLMLWGSLDNVAPTSVADYAYHHQLAYKRESAQHWQAPCASHYVQYDHASQAAALIDGFLHGQAKPDVSDCPLQLKADNRYPLSAYARDSHGAPAGQMLSAYWGIDRAQPVIPFCVAPGTAGGDGLPVVFSLPFAPTTDFSNPGRLFRVTSSTGAIGSVACATLNPAIDAHENRTVLLVGQFADGQAGQTIGAVDVIGDLKFADGSSARGLTLASASALNAGEHLMLAEQSSQASYATGSGNASGCPSPSTKWVVKTTFEGGVRGQAQVGDFTLKLANTGTGEVRYLNPSALSQAEQADNDNHVSLCFGDYPSGFQPIAVAIKAAVYQDPAGVANPRSTSSVLTSPTP
jgi:pimeloyl-ACP methyl ester carboxylesterase